MPHVADDADDGAPWAVSGADTHRLTDRIGIRPERARGLLADEGTFAAPAIRAGEQARPRRSGMRITEKYSGVTEYRSTEGSSGPVGRPST